MRLAHIQDPCIIGLLWGPGRCVPGQAHRWHRDHGAPPRPVEESLLRNHCQMTAASMPAAGGSSTPATWGSEMPTLNNHQRQDLKKLLDDNVNLYAANVEDCT